MTKSLGEKYVEVMDINRKLVGQHFRSVVDWVARKFWRASVDLSRRGVASRTTNTGYRTYLGQENGAYYLDLWVKQNNDANGDKNYDLNHNNNYNNTYDDSEDDRRATDFAGPGI